MKKVLKDDFFNRKTVLAAQELLGKFLVRKIDGKKVTHMITETEAYIGPHDLACKASRGRTPGCEPMFAEAGTIYVYFTYGMHWMLNIVTEEKDYPAAVLIRATEHVSGPARLTKALGINKSLNGKKLGKVSGLWIEENPDHALHIKNHTLIRTPRIGIDSAGPLWANKKLRFLLKKN